MKNKVSIFWFRRDLRLQDNAALYEALKNNEAVLPVFIFDRNILDQLDDSSDRRVDFIHQALADIKIQLRKFDSDLVVLHTTPLEAFEKIINTYAVKAVYANHDYEPYASERDSLVKEFLREREIEFITYKDQCIFEKGEVVKENGKPYTVFTPYSRAWKKKLQPYYYRSYPGEKYFKNFARIQPLPLISLEAMGFKKTSIIFEAKVAVNEITLKHYKTQRDTPSLNGTSRLSIHLRFGTISIRSLVSLAFNTSEAFLNELIWRDFYMMILWHFPYVARAAFKKEYGNIPWRNNEQEFNLWCQGKTGFPIVDAGMRELNATGFMHNRVRMIVSSFLVKDLLIDWRWGEAYFARKLDDFDLSANNGGWQWAAGSGCDAAPYFRVFNPAAQQEKFDPDFKYIKKWVPEFGTTNYPEPIIDHAAARLRALKVYKAVLEEQRQTKLF